MTLLAALTRLRTNNLKGLSTTLTFYRPRDRMRIRKLTLGSASAINATEARRQAREILGQIAAGKDPADERLAYRDGSLRIAYDAFKAEHLPKVSREHARHRVRIFERHFLPKLGDKVLSKISRAEIKEIIDRIAKKHKIAACNAHRGFSAFLSWCVEHGLIEHHVMKTKWRNLSAFSKSVRGASKPFQGQALVHPCVRRSYDRGSFPTGTMAPLHARSQLG